MILDCLCVQECPLLSMPHLVSCSGTHVKSLHSASCLEPSQTRKPVSYTHLVLMHSDLADVPAALDLSRATMRNIKQNLFWALFYNAICIPVADVYKRQGHMYSKTP